MKNVQDRLKDKEYSYTKKNVYPIIILGQVLQCNCLFLKKCY